MEEIRVSPRCHTHFLKNTCFYEHGFRSGGEFMLLILYRGKPTKRTTIWTLTLTNSRSVSWQPSWTLTETTVTKENQLKLVRFSLYFLRDCYVLPTRCISTLFAIVQTSHVALSKLHEGTWRFKKCKYCAFQAHQRCTIITCDTHNFFVTFVVKSTASSGMRKKIHETWHTSANTCTRSAQLQSFEHHLQQRSLEIISCKVYWRQSQVNPEDPCR